MEETWVSADNVEKSDTLKRLQVATIFAWAKGIKVEGGMQKMGRPQPRTIKEMIALRPFQNTKCKKKDDFKI